MLTGREIETYDDPAAGFFAPAADEDLPGLPIRLHYSAKQVEFIRATEWLTGFVGAIRAGKTYGLMGWVGDKMYEQRGTGTIGGIFANTYSQLSQSTLPELWEVFNKLGFEHGKDYVYNEAPPAAWNYPSRFKKKHDATLTVRYWGQCIVRSLDQPETIRGVTLGWAAIDEARGATEAAFDVVIGRVSCKRCTKPQIKLATSPNGYDWIYERLVDKAPKSCRRIHATTAENAANLLPGYVDQLRGMYDPAMAEQELEGKFVRIATGAVFRCFDRNVHVGDDVTLDLDADLHVSYDFNRTPFAIIIAQVRNYPAGPGLAFIDEIALRDADTQLASEELVRRITSLYPPGKTPRSVQVHGDAAGRQRNTKNNWSDYDIVTKVLGAAYGARFVPRWPMSNPGVIESINAVNGLLKNSLGQVRVRVHPRCAKLIRDFEQVSFRPGSTDIDKVTNKDLTHWSDGARYMIEELFPIASRTGVNITI